jgi:hypothetical protein
VPAPPPATVVSLLDVDPELAALVPAPERGAARRRAVARTGDFPRGPWSYDRPMRDPGAFGLLVIDGLVGARSAAAGQAHLEVLGEGDLLRPWVSVEAEASVPAQIGWHAFEAGRVAVLDEHFALAVAPWPQIAATLMHRCVLRARRLSLQLALAGVERIDDRVLLALWHFADRWGRVTHEGVVLRLALTHAQLAEVVRAARTSVTSAIGELRRRGALSVKRRDHCWVLHGRPPAVVSGLERQVGLP